MFLQSNNSTYFVSLLRYPVKIKDDIFIGSSFPGCNRTLIHLRVVIDRHETESCILDFINGALIYKALKHDFFIRLCASISL